MSIAKANQIYELGRPTWVFLETSIGLEGHVHPMQELLSRDSVRTPFHNPEVPAMQATGLIRARGPVL
eukprot:4521805-Amphidinium_carterae.1